MSIQYSVEERQAGQLGPTLITLSLLDKSPVSDDVQGGDMEGVERGTGAGHIKLISPSRDLSSGYKLLHVSLTRSLILHY